MHLKQVSCGATTTTTTRLQRRDVRGVRHDGGAMRCKCGAHGFNRGGMRINFILQPLIRQLHRRRYARHLGRGGLYRGLIRFNIIEKRLFVNFQVPTQIEISLYGSRLQFQVLLHVPCTKTPPARQSAHDIRNLETSKRRDEQW